MCDATTMERFVDPVIADLQHEHEEASRSGPVWRCAWVRIAGALAFWRVMGAIALEQSVGVGEWSAADVRIVGRVLGFVTVATVAVTLLLNLPVLLHPGPLLRHQAAESPFLFLTLIPAAFPVAAPVGVLFGILYALRHVMATTRIRSATVIVALCGALASFSTLAWIIPAGERTFWTAVNDTAPNGLPRRSVNGPLRLPPNALTIGELREELKALEADGRRGSVRERIVAADYYQRFTFSVMPIVFGLLALGLTRVGRLRRSPVALGAMGVATCVCYWLLLWAARAAVLQGSGAAAAWMPNVIFLLGTFALAKHTRPIADPPRSASRRTLRT